MSVTNKKQVFPDRFFAIPHPTEPWVAIQFRVGTIGNLSKPENWEEITMNPSNFFDNLTIEDNGGFQRLTLNLMDKNFTKLEGVISRSILAARLANVVKEEQRVKDDTGYFEFKLDNNAMINLRLRFGYSSPEENMIDDTVFDDKYADRVNGDIPVIRSPWIYFQILNVKFNLAETGMTAELTAFSTADTFLDRAKMMRKYAIIRGTPSNILTDLGNLLKELSSGDLEFSVDDKPLHQKNEDGGETIDINLGGSPKGNVSWRNLRSLLNELMSKIPPRIYTSKFVEADNTDATRMDAESEKIEHTVRYDYYLEQKEEKNGIKSIIHFHYPDPIKKSNEQNVVRTYIWREYPKSIVKGFTVESKTDFASLNQQILVRDGAELKLYVPPSKGDTANPRRVKLTEVTEALNKDYKISFVSDMVDLQNANSSDRGMNTNIIAQQLVHFLNQGVFNGALSLPGDPYYLFDKSLKPFQYIVKIVIMRPEYIDEDGSLVQESQSYLSGFYNVSSISHSLSGSGFDTTLNVIRWPGD